MTRLIWLLAVVLVCAGCGEPKLPEGVTVGVDGDGVYMRTDLVAAEAMEMYEAPLE